MGFSYSNSFKYHILFHFSYFCWIKNYLISFIILPCEKKKGRKWKYSRTNYELACDDKVFCLHWWTCHVSEWVVIEWLLWVTHGLQLVLGWLIRFWPWLNGPTIVTVTCHHQSYVTLFADHRRHFRPFRFSFYYILLFISFQSVFNNITNSIF